MDANLETKSEEVMLRERYSSEKQTSKSNSTDLSENADHTGNTNHIVVTEQHIFSSRIIEDSDDDEEEEDDETGKKRYIIIGSIIGTLALIGIAIFWYFKFWKLTPVEIVQKKCKEYTDLACSLQASGDESLSRIHYGDAVPVGMLPHQALLSFTLKNTPGYASCGGSLINERFILTAAHCTRNASLTDYKVLLGHLNRQTANPSSWKQVKKIHIHPTYIDKPDILSDISLLELDEDVKFTSNVRPICLNTKLEQHYDFMIASGWGTTENDQTSNYLKKVELRNNDDVIKTCRDFLKHESHPLELLNERVICLAHLRQGVDAGDSGGPLQVKLKNNCNNTWEEIGVAAEIRYYPAPYQGFIETAQLFVKVEYYIPWIASLAWPD